MKNPIGGLLDSAAQAVPLPDTIIDRDRELPPPDQQELDKEFLTKHGPAVFVARLYSMTEEPYQRASDIPRGEPLRGSTCARSLYLEAYHAGPVTKDYLESYRGPRQLPMMTGDPDLPYLSAFFVRSEMLRASWLEQLTRRDISPPQKALLGTLLETTNLLALAVSEFSSPLQSEHPQTPPTRDTIYENERLYGSTLLTSLSLIRIRVEELQQDQHAEEQGKHEDLWKIAIGEEVIRIRNKSTNVSHSSVVSIRLALLEALKMKASSPQTGFAKCLASGLRSAATDAQNHVSSWGQETVTAFVKFTTELAALLPLWTERQMADGS